MKEITLADVVEKMDYDLTDDDERQAAESLLTLCQQVVKHNLRGGLKQLINLGPLHDGDVASKTDRDALVSLGLAAKIIAGGEQGFQAATYTGWTVMTLIDAAVIAEQ